MRPRWFGRYRLLNRLGVGGWAEVWSALDEESGERVAVKRLHPHIARDPSARVRLRREASAVAALRHPAIVGLREVVETPDDAAIVLDFIDGEPLSERLARDGSLGGRDALGVVRRIAAALAAAHAKGIVHRDVKPSNVLLDRDGRAYLTDFGIARSAEAPTLLTGADTVVGTLRYLAPELLRGEPATTSSDVWALGALAWQLVEGRPPYDGIVPVELIAAQAQAPARPAGLPEDIGRLIVRALEPDPARRPVDAGAFLDELEAAVDPPTELLPAAPTSGPAERTGEPIAASAAAPVAAAPPVAAAASRAPAAGAADPGAALPVATAAATAAPDPPGIDDLMVRTQRAIVAGSGAAAVAGRALADRLETLRADGFGGPAAGWRRALPLAALGVLVLAVAALAGIDPSGGTPVGAGVPPSAIPSLAPAPTEAVAVEPEAGGGKGKGNGKDHGRGKGNGSHDDEDDHGDD